MSRLETKISTRTTAPHPFPYQGSKRGIAKFILPYFPPGIDRVVEPCCGSAAVSIAAATHGLARRFWINDLNAPLMALWMEIVERPEQLVADYARLWRDQQPHMKEFFFGVRREFNESHQPSHLLYLLARIVKGSVRYNADGAFNQSPDNRRAGMRPSVMRRQMLGVHRLLTGRTSLSSMDYRRIALKSTPGDLVYFDPPYQGTSQARDRRYCDGVDYDEFVRTLRTMNELGLSYVVSYDGRTGDKAHGKLLPRSLQLHHICIPAGRSTQATLLGQARQTVESLYLSPTLVRRLENPEPCAKAVAHSVHPARHRKPHSVSCAMARMTPQLGQSPT